MTEPTTLTAYDEECLAKAASTEGLALEPHIIGPMSVAGMEALQASIQEVPRRPGLAAEFRLKVRNCWVAWWRSQ